MLMKISANYYHLAGIVTAACALSYCFFLVYNPAFYYTKSIAHAQVGYSVYTYDSLNISRAYEQKHRDASSNAGRLVDLALVHAPESTSPQDSFPINDTVAYGVLLGFLWKLTHSLSYIDVQFLQVLLYVLSLVLYYYCALWLFDSTSCAFACSVAYLFFFPITAMVVQPISDIWAYYGAVVLLFLVCMLLHDVQRTWILILGSICIALCQWVRPALFMALITMSIVLMVLWCTKRISGKKLLPFLVILWGMNIAVFWIPFCAFNKQTYNRYIVGPFGQDLLEGLGEFPNQWGYKLDDIWIADYIGTKYAVVYGTPEFDDAARKEFDSAYAQDPLFFYSSVVCRIPQIILPGLAWIYKVDSPYAQFASPQEKLHAILTDTHLVLDFLLRHVYIRLYLVLGYIGIALLFLRKQYWIIFLLLGGIVCGGLGKLPSHIEYRYIVPFYWVFSFFVGYACMTGCTYVRKNIITRVR